MTQCTRKYGRLLIEFAYVCNVISGVALIQDTSSTPVCQVQTIGVVFFWCYVLLFAVFAPVYAMKLPHDIFTSSSYCERFGLFMVVVCFITNLLVGVVWTSMLVFDACPYHVGKAVSAAFFLSIYPVCACFNIVESRRRHLEKTTPEENELV